MRRAQSGLTPSRKFKLFCPATTFRKSECDGSQPGQMRIAGIISTERLDHQGEKVLQKGLDLDYLLGERGTYNNEHGATHHDVLGFPQTVSRFQKGDTLPNGQTAASNCTWAEGVLLNEPDGIKTFEKAQALQEHGRSLGFSIEGSVEERRGAGGYIISKAKVNHVAITHQPVNDDTRLELLARSLRPRLSRKAMEAGAGGSQGAINPLVCQDKDDEVVNLTSAPVNMKVREAQKKALRARRRQNAQKKKSLTQNTSLHSVFKAFPFAGVTYALRLAADMNTQRKEPCNAR